MNQIIEVKIIKRKINYIATSTLFPQCKGIGKSKAEALQKLSSSISSFISKMVNSSLSNVFSSNNYTQIMLDQTKETNEETLAFNLTNSQVHMPKSFLLKVSAFTEEGEDNPTQDASHSNDINDFFSPQFEDDDGFAEETTLGTDLFEQLTLQQKSSQDPDAIVFGFPLNLN